MGQGIFDDIFPDDGGVADCLVDLFSGEQATITYTTGATEDKTTMTKSGGTDVSYNIDASPLMPYTTSEIDGTQIIKGDVSTIIAANQLVGKSPSGEAPPKGAKVVADSVTWRLEGIEKIKSGAKVASYILQLRRI